MSVIVAFSYPVRVELEHNDTPVDTVVDEWGEHPVYQISVVRWQNLTTNTYTVVVKDEQDRIFTGVIAPLESGLKNLPTPTRFNSYPLEVHCSFTRV